MCSYLQPSWFDRGRAAALLLPLVEEAKSETMQPGRNISPGGTGLDS